MRLIILLGSTGSIGRQTLEVISENQDRFKVIGLGAGGSDLELLADQVVTFTPTAVSLANELMADEFAAALERAISRAGLAATQFQAPRVLLGSGSATELAAMPCDIVVNAITGIAGLDPTLATLRAGTSLALANKESLVVGGKLVTSAAKPGQILAVDSEHSAIAQALRAGRCSEVSRLILTASGGPFRGFSAAELERVSPTQAMAHPTWNMGRVITINSATLVNKGLELLEAGLLYGVDLDNIVVAVHPQSIVHSMVEFCDGSTIAQASPPDMRLPIGLALTWPERLSGVARACDWTKSSEWSFEPLDNEAFPAVELARKAGKASGSAPAVYNGTNEVCVDAFCAGRICFPDISRIISRVLHEHLTNGEHVSDDELTVSDVHAADIWARARAEELIS